VLGLDELPSNHHFAQRRDQGAVVGPDTELVQGAGAIRAKLARTILRTHHHDLARGRHRRQLLSNCLKGPSNGLNFVKAVRPRQATVRARKRRLRINDDDGVHGRPVWSHPASVKDARASVKLKAHHKRCQNASRT
jgi:hypothetical protein